MNVIIVDNESYVVKAIRQLIAVYCPNLKIVGDAGTIKAAKSLINQYRIDLVFLDIELDDGTGIDLLRQIPDIDFQVIFITAYDQYAIQAFKFAATDYLLKPLDPDDLIDAVGRAQKAIETKSSKLKMATLLDNVKDIKSRNRKIIVVNRESVHAISVDKILYLKADGAYTEFILNDKKIISSKNLKSYDDVLSEHNFFRTHHSYLVNLVYLTRYDKLDSVIVLENGMTIPVSQRKRDSIMEEIKKISMM